MYLFLFVSLHKRMQDKLGFYNNRSILGKIRRKQYNRSAFSADINECAGKRGDDFHQDCHECINENPGYRCKCNNGFREDNSTNNGNCIDINECEVGEEDIDECLGDEGVTIDKDCHTCVNTQGSYTCECDEGYERHPNDKRCIDVNECERDLYDVGCHTCVNFIGGHSCLCNDTFILDNNSNNETCIGEALLCFKDAGKRNLKTGRFLQRREGNRSLHSTQAKKP
ncbi:hypothetical protein CAPTEDRAFT_218715 [Capitella teleta]|uniref:EGF-like domain-containing protein n=1 Tax=Capitella teleta TaxID=283909 RepID=R7UAA0_CAPTE|nr:hypothetical protein CAPTEDRAFT_218715 [Capitella teleta]|eukprot:ELU00066.1 hypothetical protein CAPTEDRAFT_218715 [Capitella teleta]